MDMRPRRVRVDFTATVCTIPPLDGVLAVDAEAFRARVLEHASPYLNTGRRGRDGVSVRGNPDAQSGQVLVEAGAGDPVVAAEFTVCPAASTGAASAVRSGGVPGWVWVAAIIVIAVIAL